MSDFLALFLPTGLLTVTALVCLGLGALRRVGPEGHARLAGWITMAGLVAALAAVFFGGRDARLAAGMLASDSLIRLMSAVVLVMGGVAALFLREVGVRRHAAENMAVLLLAVAGLLVMVSTENLLLMFVGLELAGISLYILVGFAQDNRMGAAAALKYFLFGSVAAAFLLFGLSLLHGVAGSLDFRVIAETSAARLSDPLVLAAMVMILAGFGFKVAAVPFHLWAPDVYEGAPEPAAALIASGSKAAGFFVLGKFLTTALEAVGGAAGWGGFAPGWMPILAVVAALSMVLGNLGALGQSSVRRLLAFSGVGHAGFLLAALLAGDGSGFRAVCFYVVIYGVATLGAFGAVSVVRRATGGDDLDDFAGLAESSPLLAVCMTIFLMSLAGLPPLAGFYGKFALFAAALSSGGLALVPAPALLWLVALALATSALSLYYYLQIVKRIFFREAPGLCKLTPDPGTAVALLLLAATLLVIGVVPNLLYGLI